MERRKILLFGAALTTIIGAMRLYRQKITKDGATGFRPILNPMIERETDGYGSGAYGASRDGGTRSHAGTDFVSTHGQQVYAPFAGVVARIYQVYTTDTRYKGIDIKGDNGWYCRLFYVDAVLPVGTIVQPGTLIATAKSLQAKYPGITDHVHLEIRRGDRTGTHQDPTTFFTHIV